MLATHGAAAVHGIVGAHQSNTMTAGMLPSEPLIPTNVCNLLLVASPWMYIGSAATVAAPVMLRAVLLRLPNPPLRLPLARSAAAVFVAVDGRAEWASGLSSDACRF